MAANGTRCGERKDDRNVLGNITEAGQDGKIEMVNVLEDSNCDSAGIAAALIRLWHSNKTRDWTNRVIFLTKGPA